MTQHPVHFLLVDDLEENLLSLDALLRREGLVLLKARSGPQALEMLLQYDVALALLDVQMPGMDGFELAELMRGPERTRNVPIIFLTAGSADSKRRFRGYETGAVDFIHKPVEPDVLRSKADVFFKLARQQRELSYQRDELKTSADTNAQLLAESQQYAAALQQADRRKDEFLATLAHELRNPLAPIRNGLQILRMGATDDVALETREMMDRQLTHLVRLIDDLLDVSRVSQGKIDLRREHITLQSALESAVETSRPLIDTANHELTLNIPDEPLWLDADLTRIAQVVSNLLNNAAKYTPVGGHISLSVESQGKDVAITVRDDGLGIPAEELPNVFELFTQVDRNLARAQGGLGIGLALVRRLVEMHAGRIDVTSPGLNQGSSFTVHLPLANIQTKNDAPEAMDDDTRDTATPLRVLVVDDNVPSAKTIGWMLELSGHMPTLAHDGESALDLARKLQPDVVLLDIVMPGMNGYDVCRALRDDPTFAGTVMIAQTGWGQARDRQQAREAGFDHHLTKPVKFEDLDGLLHGIAAERLNAA